MMVVLVVNSSTSWRPETQLNQEVPQAEVVDVTKVGKEVAKVAGRAARDEVVLPHSQPRAAKLLPLLLPPRPLLVKC